MNKLSTRNLTLAGLFIAFGLLLPFLTAQIPSLGNKFLPMHIPVLISGFVCGWRYGLAIGLTVPIFRSLLFGMPPMFPVAAAMAVELAVYGGMTGILYKLLPKKTVSVYIALIAAMLCGRVAWGGASILLYGLGGMPYTWELFIAGAFFNAIPGIAVQLIIVPALAIALQKAGVMRYE
ncbi:MAG TPA: ECF transporter S component [Clostridia bacterium]|nr:ECF transporter S component [Clostridia bacterium]